MSGFLWDYLVGGKCVNDPLMTPDKKEWMNCTTKIAKYNLISSIIGAVVIMTILIIVLSLVDAGGLYWFGAFAIGALIIGSAVVKNMMSAVSAEARWDAAETKVRAQLGNITDEKYFVDFEKYNEPDKKDVKAKWLDGAKKIRDIENEQSRVRAAELQGKGMYLTGVGQASQGITSLANATLGVYKEFHHTPPDNHKKTQ